MICCSETVGQLKGNGMQEDEVETDDPNIPGLPDIDKEGIPVGKSKRLSYNWIGTRIAYPFMHSYICMISIFYMN